MRQEAAAPTHAKQARPATPNAGSGLLDLTRESDDTAVDTTMRAAVDDLTRLLQTQTAAGAFGWAGDLERVALNQVADWADRGERIEEQVSTWAAGHADAAVAVATAKALVLLHRAFAADRAVWSRAAEKATRFLASVIGRPVAELTAWLTRSA